MSLNICGMVPIRKAEREAAGRFLCHSGDIVFILLFVCPGPGMVWYSGNTGVWDVQLLSSRKSWSSWSIYLLFTTLYLKIISTLQKSCKVRIEQRICALPILSHLLYQLHTHSLYIYMVSLSESFENKLHISLPFTTKYFSEYFLRTRIFSYRAHSHIAVISVSEFNSAALCSFSVDSVMYLLALFCHTGSSLRLVSAFSCHVIW